MIWKNLNLYIWTVVVQIYSIEIMQGKLLKQV